MTTYGFVGLGNMGGPMAEHLIEAGLDVLVFDALEASMEPFKGRAKIATSLEEMGAQADVVFLSLPTPQLLKKSALGKVDFIRRAAPKSFLIYQQRDQKWLPQFKSNSRLQTLS